MPYELSGQTVQRVVDPHAGTVIGVEDRDGNPRGGAPPLDALANTHRRRRQPDPEGTPPLVQPLAGTGPNRVELAYQQYHGRPAREGN